MDFGSAVVVLGPELPHAKVGRAVRPLDVVDEILHEGHFVHRVDDLQARMDHLHQKYQVERHHVELSFVQIFKNKQKLVTLGKR